MRRSSLLALLPLFLLTLANAQNLKAITGYFASPDYYLYQFTEPPRPGYSEFRKDFSYSAGGYLLIQVNRVGLSGGISYSTKDFGLNYTDIALVPRDPHFPTTLELKLSYIEFPILLHITYLQKKHVELFASGGVVFSSQLYQDEITYHDDSAVATSEFDNKITRKMKAIQVSSGVIFKVSPWLNIAANPYFRHYFGLLDTEYAEKRTMQLGLQIEMRLISQIKSREENSE